MDAQRRRCLAQVADTSCVIIILLSIADRIGISIIIADTIIAVVVIVICFEGSLQVKL